MTVCGNKLSGVCGSCEHLQRCRNGELDKVPMTNEEWFCQLPTGEKAEFFADIYPKSVGEALIKISNGDKEKWEEWLKEKHE